MIPFAWQLGIAVVVSVGAWLHGRSFGADQTQAKWDKAELDRERYIQAQEASNRHQAHMAGERYETQKAQLQQQATQAREELRNALNGSICPDSEDSHALQLADLPIPSGAVDRLRSAAGSSTKDRAPSP